MLAISVKYVFPMFYCFHVQPIYGILLFIFGFIREGGTLHTKATLDHSVLPQ